MEIIVHRGTREVGGTIIEVVSDGHRIILDVGMPLFDANREPHDGQRLRKMAKDELVSEGIIPPVPGLFDDDNAPPDAILLSHAHLDHTGLLGHARNTIPVHASKGTSKMMLAGRLFASQVEIGRERFHELWPGQPEQIGPFQVTAFPVDHSVFGCVSLLIEADGKSVLYSGDVRLHGRAAGQVDQLIEAVSDRRIDVLMMEGTHFGLPTENDRSEDELQSDVCDIVRDTNGLVLASFSPQHVDRLIAFMQAASNAGRTFVADIYTAFILHLVGSELDVPAPTAANNVRVYYPSHSVTSYKRRRLDRFFNQFAKSRIELDEIRARPESHLMAFRPSMLSRDFAGELPRNSTCIYSYWSGYLEKPDWLEVSAAIESSDSRLLPVHSTGHMLEDDIIRFACRINARTVIPVHTFEPETFQKHLANVTVLNDGQRWPT